MPTLTDKIIRHQVYLEGLKGGALNAFNPVLVGIDREIRMSLLNVGSEGLGVLSKAALLKLMRSLRLALLKRYNTYSAELLRFLQAFMAVEFKTMRSIFQDEPTPEPDEEDASLVGIWWPRVAASVLPANGVILSSFAQALGPAAALAATQTLLRSAANRDSRDATLEAVEALRKRLEGNARAVMATTLQSVSAQSQAAFAKMVGIDEYEWVSILDSRTSDICRSRSGLRYEYGKGPLPPAHPNCRSMIVPVVDGVAIPNPSFRDWVSGLPTKVSKDMFRGPIGDKFEGTRAVTLREFEDKIELILMD